MRLLLDEMHSSAVAAVLRSRGHDVIAVTERSDLIGLADPTLLHSATAEDLALVTENVKDFAVLHHQILGAGGRHAGLIFTHSRRFPRSARNHVAALTDALAAFEAEHSHDLREVESFVWWLERARPH